MERAPSILERSVLGPIAIDLAAVVLFVVIGRDEHQQTNTLGDVLTVAAPFLIGVLAGSALALALGRALRSLSAGLIVLVTTLALGMALRRFVWDRGTALAFVFVTTGFLAVCLLGWRGVAALISQRAGARRAVGPSHL